MNVEFKYYKPGQGTWARWTAGIFGGLLSIFASHSLYLFPAMEKIDAVGNVTGRTFWGKQIAASLPGIKQGLTVGLLGATLLFIAGCLATYLFAVNGRRAADFLIDVESEMHRVSWPTRPEWMGSSVVVIVSVVVIGGFVTLVDFLFRFVFTKTGIL